jgi:hypothetical protein
VVILVADAGLGTINSIRLSMEALRTVTGGEAGNGAAGVRTVVVLDRFDGRHDIHRRNRTWLIERDGYEVVTVPGEEPRLTDLLSPP